MTPSRTPLRDRIAAVQRPAPKPKPAWLERLTARDDTGRLLS